MAVRTPALSRPRLLLPVVGVVVVVLIALGLASGLYTDLLFFREIGYSNVFSTILGTRVGLFVAGAVFMSVVVGANLTLAYVFRPAYRPLSLEQQNLDRYRMVVEPHLRALLIVVGALIALFAGASLQGKWQIYQLWQHGTHFGVTDPQFHRDVSFYAFTYPFIRMLLGFGFAAVVLSLLAAFGTHYLFGGIRFQTRGDRFEPAARGHLSVLLGLFFLLKAVAYYYDRYGLVFSPRGIVTGASYTDVHIVLPAKTVLIVITLLCAVLSVANAWTRNWQLPGISAGLLVASALVIGFLVPTVVEATTVRPNAITKEAPYIKRNIDATLAAYRLDGKNLLTTDYSGTGDPTALATDPSVQTSARLLDPNRLAPTFQQLQQQRSYFGFPATLDIDRYDLGGGTTDAVVAAREVDLAGLPPGQDNWINTHLVYTHGNGFVAAQANAVDPTGKPIFAIGNLPPSGPNGTPPALKIAQQRIYFGEQSPPYSIVGTKQQEVDGPDASQVGESTSSYSGKGGVKIDSTARRLLYALHFRDTNLILSSALTGNSKILYNREPRARVAKAAPYLTLDQDPYPAVVDGRLIWIVDGYTTSDGFPYAQRTTLGDVTADSLTNNTQLGRQTAPPDQVNYIRNSVKATVDAYDGTVKLYAVDEADPVLATWRKVFPNTVLPSAAVTPQLRAHFRYPEDLFKVQRDLLSKYHVTDPAAFYQGPDFWNIPDDPTPDSPGKQPPFYLFGQVAGQDRPSFNLTTSYVAQKRPNSTALLAVSSDPADYGVFRLLRLPSNTQVQGVGQVESSFRQQPKIAADLTLLDQRGSKVTYGNLLTIPVGKGLLFVQPLYVSASSGETYPKLNSVLVAFGDRIGDCPTLQAALLDVVSGAEVKNCTGTATAPAPPPTTTGGPPTPVVSDTLARAISDADAAFTAYQAAVGRGDFAEAGRQQQALSDALKRLGAFKGSLPAPAPSATPAPAGSAATTPGASPSAGGSPAPSPTG